MKKQYYKTCQIKKKQKQKQNRPRIQYNKYYLICTSIIVYYNYCYRQKAKKLKTAAEEETMACAKYSPRVHKLRTLCSEQSLIRRKIYCFCRQILFPWGQTANVQAVREWGKYHLQWFRKAKLVEAWWRRLSHHQRDRYLRTVERKRHCWSLTEIIDGPNSS